MKNKILFSLSLLSLGLLHACGGGSGGGGSGMPLGIVPPSAPSPMAEAAAPVPAAADSGSVSALFVRAERARYLLLGVGAQSFGVLSQSEQAASGAMTRLNDNTLTGSSATKEINGDANFAIGRWTAGTVTRSSGAETLTGADNRAYHYLALNELKTLPASATTTCDAGVFTSPTYVGGGSGAAANSGAASGSSTLAFGSEGAVVAGTVKVTVGDAAGSVNFDTKVKSPSSTSVTGSFLSAGAGAGITLGDHGGGAYAIAVGYSATLPSGARYMGVAKFRCA
ncbi:MULTISPECIES: hypothetical protein [Variovorax]|jgi:hypothetical protein|uniref:hypothetical protein n=1 Tax=Variovorax TaxID=34072 RepID=UPI001AC4B83F|nr:MULTISPECIES: hypothetical protein [Variovorax]MBN8757194.1 hypothetical protein [Variovorax sp.]UKI06393.1 hypothetical protein L3V85_26750 [Variovorax paradoxus]